MDALDHKLDSIKRGYYFPSFFELGIEVYDSLENINVLSEWPFSTFIHEYIHFLQDITTTYGLINIVSVAERIKLANHTIRSTVDKEFVVPIDYTVEHTVSLSKEILNIYLGDRIIIKKLSINKIYYTTQTIETPEFGKRAVGKIMVEHISDAGTMNFCFGALCIQETMAHIAQKQFYPEILHEDSPYRVAEIIAQNIYSVIGDNQLYVFSLCDASLMYNNPGKSFINSLHLMRAYNFKPNSEIDIYKFVYYHIKTENGSPIEIQYAENIEIAKSQLKAYFNIEALENERKWVDTVFNNAYKLRIDSPTFLVDILKYGRESPEHFGYITEQLGTPLIFNIERLAWFNPPKEMKGLTIRIDQFAAIKEIIKLYELGNTECGLINYCRIAGEKDWTDHNCASTPWKRATEGDACAYGFLWNIWGLSSYSPKIAAQ